MIDSTRSFVFATTTGGFDRSFYNYFADDDAAHACIPIASNSTGRVNVIRTTTRFHVHLLCALHYALGGMSSTI